MTALEQIREDQALGAAWRRAEAALPEGWYRQLFDYGPPGPYIPGPDTPFHTPRYQASANLGILSSPPKVFGRSDDSATAALTALTDALAKRATTDLVVVEPDDDHGWAVLCSDHGRINLKPTREDAEVAAAIHLSRRHAA